MRRFLLALLGILALATALPRALAPADASAGIPGFVSVAASSYYDSGPVWWVAITENGQWWTLEAFNSPWTYRGIIGSGHFVSIAGGSGTNHPQWVAITDTGEWWTNESFSTEWTNRGLIGGTAGIPDPPPSTPNAQPTTWGQVKARSKQ